MIVETIKEEIIDEVVNVLDEVKLDASNIQVPIILVGDIETKFIDFIGVERFHISKMNSRTSLFQVEGSNVGQNLQSNLCNLLFLVFLCNYRYFRFRAFISLFVGVFNVF